MNITTVVTKYNNVPVVYTIDNQNHYYQLEFVGNIKECRYQYYDFGKLIFTVNVLARADINRELFKSDGRQLYYVPYKGEYTYEPFKGEDNHEH